VLHEGLVVVIDGLAKVAQLLVGRANTGESPV
jgi:hypothetical protein